MIAAVVMAHPKRDTAAIELAEQVGAEIVWDEANDEWDTAARAWQAPADDGSDWSLVIQDDAIPIPDLRRHVSDMLKHLTVETAVSLYAGTGRPRADTVRRAVARADRVGASWLQCNTLLWGVAVLLPTAHITPMLTWCKDRREPYDQRIGRYYRTVLHLPVRYTWPSLVDHADTEPLVQHNRPHVERRAHRVAPPITWTGPIVSF